MTVVIKQKSDGEEDAAVPESLDGGWGWMVVFGSFMIHVIADGVAYSFGIYVETFTDFFDASHSQVGFLGSLMMGVTWGTGPIASMLVNKYGCRIVTIAGTFIAAFGFVISIFAPNIYFMYFSFGIVAGFGLGMAYLPAIVAVSFYFEKKRSFATGLAVCGSGLGTFIFAPITELLLEEYGWKGTVLIESAILLNCLLCGAVFRPIETKKPAISPGNKETSETALELTAVGDQNLKAIATSCTSLPIPDGKELMELRFCSESHVNQVGKKPQNGSSSHGSQAAIISPMARKDIFYTASLENIPMYKSDPDMYKKSVTSIAKIHDRDADEYSGCSLWKIIGCSEERQAQLASVMDCTLMCDICFVLFAFSNLLTSIGFCVPYIFLPSRAIAMDISTSQAAFLISIVGISNTLGRIVFGFLSDLKCVNRLMLYNTVLVMCGVCSILSSLCINFALMATYSALFGSLIGVYVCLTPTVLVDLLGLNRLSNAFGLVLMFQGIGSVVGPPMAGAVYDATHNYDNSFYMMGACIVVSGAMLYPIPWIQRCQKKHVSQTDIALGKLPTTSNNGSPDEHKALTQI